MMAKANLWEKYSYFGSRALLRFIIKVNRKETGSCKQGAQGINEVRPGCFVCEQL